VAGVVQVYDLTYTSLTNLFVITDVAAGGILGHAIIFGGFLIIFLYMITMFSLGKSLMVSGITMLTFSIILVAVGIANPGDMILMLLLTLIGVFLR
jgi:hypothetical protein